MSEDIELLPGSKQLHTVRRRFYTQGRIDPATYTDGANEEVFRGKRAWGILPVPVPSDKPHTCA